MEKRNQPPCWPFDVHLPSIPHEYFSGRISLLWENYIISITESMSMGKKYLLL
jgi:hypothetical protein